MQSYTYTHKKKKSFFFRQFTSLPGVFLWFPILHCATKPIWFSPKGWGPAGGRWDCLKWTKIIPKKIKGSRIIPQDLHCHQRKRSPAFCFRWHVWQPRFFLQKAPGGNARKQPHARLLLVVSPSTNSPTIQRSLSNLEIWGRLCNWKSSKLRRKEGAWIMGDMLCCLKTVIPFKFVSFF